MFSGSWNLKLRVIAYLMVHALTPTISTFFPSSQSKQAAILVDALYAVSSIQLLYFVFVARLWLHSKEYSKCVYSAGCRTKAMTTNDSSCESCLGHENFRSSKERASGSYFLPHGLCRNGRRN